MNNIGDIANDIEEVLKDCGDLLQKLSDKEREEGFWIGSQFKSTADKKAHNFLVDNLSKRFPNVAIVSEESFDAYRDPVVSDYFLIDPIDGTASFSAGFRGWVCQLAFICNRKVCVAGIYAPDSGEYFSAQHAKGAFLNGESIKLKKDDADIFTVIDNYPEPTGIAKLICKKYDVSDYIESGSIGLKICRVAQGVADLFVKDMQPRDWDLAAPMLVLQEAGGVITDLRGRALVFGLEGRRHNGLVACRNCSIFRRFINDYPALG